MNWVDIVIVIILVVATLWGMRTGLLGAAFTTIGAFMGWILAGQYADDIGGIAGDSLSGQTWVTVIAYAIVIFISIIVARFALKILRPILTILTMGLVGMVDKLGGLALGLLLGIAISGALVMGAARLTYNFELPGEALADKLAAKLVETVESSVPGQDIETILAKQVAETAGEKVPSEDIARKVADIVGDNLPTEDIKAKVAEVLNDKLLNVDKGRDWLEDQLSESGFVPVFINITDKIPASAFGLVPDEFRDALDILEHEIDLRDVN